MCSTEEKTETADARPPTEALAIRTIAQRNASFTLNDYRLSVPATIRRPKTGQTGRRDVRAAAGYSARVISAPSAAAADAKTSGPGGFGGFATRWALLISVAGGLATFASFPPVDAWPLAAAGPALLVVALTGRSLRGSVGCGLAFGLAMFMPLLSWLVNEAWYAWFALAVAEAVFSVALAVGQRLLLRLTGWPVAVAGWWVTVEGVRDRWPYAFPWGRLAMSPSVAPDVRWVAIGGAPFLSFLVALTGAMIARAALGFLGGFRNGRPRTTWGAALAAAVTAGLVLAGGLLPVDP